MSKLTQKIGFLLSFFLLTFAFVSCSDGESQSSEKSILEFSINSAEGIIDESGAKILLTLPHGTDKTKLKPIIRVSEKATVNPVSNSEIDFSSSVTFTVTAEDGSKKAYAVTVNVLGDSQKQLAEFTIDSKIATINEKDKTISLTLPFGTDLTKLKPIIKISEKATVSPASGSEVDFSKPVTFTVTAEDGTTQDYTANIKAVTFDLKINSVDITSATWGEFIYVNGQFSAIGNNNKVYFVSIDGKTRFQLVIQVSSSTQLKPRIQSPILPGDYVMWIKAEDAEKSYPQTITIDRAVPQLYSVDAKEYIAGVDNITIKGYNIGTVIEKSPLVVFETTDGTEVLRTDKGTLGANRITVPASVNLAPQTYNVYVISDGRVSNKVQTKVVTSRTKPVITSYYETSDPHELKITCTGYDNFDNTFIDIYKYSTSSGNYELIASPSFSGTSSGMIRCSLNNIPLSSGDKIKIKVRVGTGSYAGISDFSDVLTIM